MARKRKEPDEVDKLVGELTKNATAAELLQDGGVLKDLKKRLVETALEAEMTEHLGYERHAVDGRGSGNSRNGKTIKRVLDGDGEFEIAVPRDRNGEFEPQLVRKRQRRLRGAEPRFRRIRPSAPRVWKLGGSHETAVGCSPSRGRLG